MVRGVCDVRGRVFALVCAAIALAVGVAGCGGSSSKSTAASGSSSTAGTSTSQPAGQVSIPITIKQTPIGRFLTVNVSVGGGRPVPVLLDTGFPFLFVLNGAIGPHVSFGSQESLSVFGHPFVGRAASAPVTIEGSHSVTTPQPIRFLATNSLTIPGLTKLGVQGDIGIGQLWPGFFSPLVQLAPPLSDGFTIALNAPGGPQLLLGKPTKTASSASVPLLPPTPGLAPPQAPTHYPNGTPTHVGFFTLCWRIAADHACGITAADTGNPGGLLPQALMPNLHQVPAPAGLPVLAPGVRVTVSAPPPSNRVVWSYTTTSQPVVGSPAYVPPPQGTFGTGLGLYLADAVGYDIVDGQLILTPSGAQ
jgi:hypothetical protein